MNGSLILIIHACLILFNLAEDVPTNENDAGFKDLIKFWKKHGIPIAKDLLSDMDEQSGNVAKNLKLGTPNIITV